MNKAVLSLMLAATMVGPTLSHAELVKREPEAIKADILTYFEDSADITDLNREIVRPLLAEFNNLTLEEQEEIGIQLQIRLNAALRNLKGIEDREAEELELDEGLSFERKLELDRLRDSIVEDIKDLDSLSEKDIKNIIHYRNEFDKLTMEEKIYLDCETLIVFAERKIDVDNLIQMFFPNNTDLNEENIDVARLIVKKASKKGYKNKNIWNEIKIRSLKAKLNNR